mmetsp:Transcript_39945/g.86105  ORF Transcript_39945/g.86105 Transcript_39945/m.86105 type:complete len:93 (+) Transcript_39945:1026-1304(+)
MKGEVYSSGSSSSSTSSSSVSRLGDISTSDEEYINIIGGGTDDEVASSTQKVVSSLGEDEIQSLFTRMERMEQDIAQTNTKLDLILQKLEGR